MSISRETFDPSSVMRKEAIDIEVETGQKVEFKFGSSAYAGKEKIELKVPSFLASLVLDAEALEYTCFEDWASSLGYDHDSRSAEKIYQECLRIGLKLRNGISQEAFEALRTACEDY